MSPKSRCAYMAGLMDGEGSFSISVTNNGKHFAANIRLYNTNRKMIQWVISNFGGAPSWSMNNGSNIETKNPTKEMCQWFLTGKQSMERFLLSLIPYLIAKKEQAKLLLAFIRMNGIHDPVRRLTLATRISVLNNGHPND